jgi:uncharacterized protein involved in type VI secretion and phage assembly
MRKQDFRASKAGEKLAENAIQRWTQRQVSQVSQIKTTSINNSHETFDYAIMEETRNSMEQSGYSNHFSF